MVGYPGSLVDGGSYCCCEWERGSKVTLRQARANTAVCLWSVMGRVAGCVDLECSIARHRGSLSEGGERYEDDDND